MYSKEFSPFKSVNNGLFLIEKIPKIVFKPINPFKFTISFPEIVKLPSTTSQPG